MNTTYALMMVSTSATCAVSQQVEGMMMEFVPSVEQMMSKELEQAWDNMRKLMSEHSMERTAWEANLLKLRALQAKPKPLTDDERYARYLEIGR